MVKRRAQVASALGMLTGGTVMLLFIPSNDALWFIGFLFCFLLVVMGILLATRRTQLLAMLQAFGIADLDMNVEFQPTRRIVKFLWFVSSVLTLTAQCLLVIAFTPVVWFWRIILLPFEMKREASTGTPKAARFLLLLIPRKDRESLVGDLEEEFATMVLPQYGPRKARWWYWWQVGASLTPIVWTQVKRIAGLILIWKAVK